MRLVPMHTVRTHGMYTVLACYVGVLAGMLTCACVHLYGSKTGAAKFLLHRVGRPSSESMLVCFAYLECLGVLMIALTG